MGNPRKTKDFQELIDSQPRRRNTRAEAERSESGREIRGIVGLGVSLFLMVALWSLQLGAAWMGPFGTTAARLVYGLAGVGAHALVVLAVVASVRALVEKRPLMPWEVGVGVGLGVLCLGVLLQLFVGDYRVGGFGPGGLVGENIAEVLRAVISTAGTALLAATGLFIAVVIATPLRMKQVISAMGDAMVWLGQGTASVALTAWYWLTDVAHAMFPGRDEVFEDEAAPTDDEIIELSGGKPREPAIIVRESDADDAPTKARRRRMAGGTVTSTGDGDANALELGGDDETPLSANDNEAGTLVKVPKKKAARTDLGLGEGAMPHPATGLAAAVPLAAPGSALALVAKGAPATPAAPPLIVESRFSHADQEAMAAKEKQAEKERKGFIKLGDGAYQLPSISLLHYDGGGHNLHDKQAMLELSARLTQTLENYGVKGDVTAIRPGPVVTMYEFSPAPGVRVNKIVNLSDDLALALAALRVRIVAPIPGKSVVGIEVPNKAREKVFLKEILADEMFHKSKAKLPMALGKDIEGGPAVVDLARMPHLLVAGTTGSGKSVAVNTMITSLLYNCSPDDVRMIMVDPKMLELSIYEGIPHLLLPVVTDPRKANLALRWAVEEMERRYDALSQMGVRDIATYNEKQARLLAKHEADALRLAADAAARALHKTGRHGADDEVDDLEAGDASEVDASSKSTPVPQRLPYIVIVIDEFADLMMCAPKEVEMSVARIAQKARAAGIHLILATQRPSVDVITGLIKANFPSRIAFHVTSKIDSRTILDQNGAEALLGAGDMLFSDRGAAPQRLHGCYVDEEEIHQVVNFLKTQARPVYNLDILKPRDEEGDGGIGGDAGGAGGGKGEDEMYDRAVAVVTQSRNASISWVQRQLRIGYNRAARIVEEMEKQGVVSPPDHTNKREVLVAAA
ncbi:MAG: DNA translocase FtsK 4TM domain-containing protein [Myxococcales bacterium]|nr:DNA translocase FtsK 4TM domain-containing protein [Myxococcales bacterium]